MSDDVDIEHQHRTADRVNERALLGAMLRSNHCIGEVCQLVRESDFTDQANLYLYRALVALYDAGKPTDLASVADWLAQMKLINSVGYDTIAKLFENAPTSHAASHYAGRIREASVIRSLIGAANDILSESSSRTAPASELLERAEQRILEIASVGTAGACVHISEALHGAADRIDERCLHQEGGCVTGVPTGWSDLDALLVALQDGELTIVAARPSVGKTSFAIGVLMHAGGFFASLEQNRVEIAERMLCAEGMVNGHNLRRGKLSDPDFKSLRDANDKLNKLGVWIDDTPYQSMMRIAANARRLKRLHNVRLVAVDYLQLIAPESRNDIREQQVAQITRRLKLLAKELAVPVVCLAQLNREAAKRSDPTPRLSDLRESGAIEQDADTVLLLHPNPSDSAKDIQLVEIIVAKQRNEIGRAQV